MTNVQTWQQILLCDSTLISMSVNLKLPKLYLHPYTQDIMTEF